MPTRSDSSLDAPAIENPRLRYGCYAVFLLTICFFAVIRFHLRDMPLERDEGEYAYMGQLMLQGIPPYSIAGNMKLPGTHAAYAISMAIFGQTPSGIRVGLLLVNAATSILVFLLAKRLYGSLAGAVAGCTYSFLSCRPYVLGVYAHATHFVVLAALAGFLLLLRAIDTRRTTLFFGSGLAFGIAFLMKQPGILFALFAGLYWLWREYKQPSSQRKFLFQGGALLVGTLLPFAFTCLVLYYASVFSNFWFWTWSYAWQYGSGTTPWLAWQFLGVTLPWVIRPFAIWGFAALGLTAPLWSRFARAHGAFIAGLFLFSVMAICPGYYFRPHYFILLLPAVALSAAVGVAALRQALLDRGSSPFLAWLPVTSFAIVFAISVGFEYQTHLRLEPLALMDALRQRAPFEDAVTTGDYIKLHSAPSDTIAILGSEPEICFYANLHCATGYLYMYPLMETQKFSKEMQNDLMSQLERAHPRFLVYVDVERSWSWQPTLQKNMAFLQWTWNFCHSGYTLVKWLPVLDDHPHLWGDQPAIYIFRRDEPQP